MIIERRNTKFGEQIVLIADDGKTLINGDTQARVVYIGNGSSILDWKEIDEIIEIDGAVEEFFNAIDQMEIKQRLIDGVQAYMDNVAKTRGYDGVLSACTYNDTLNEKFDTEGRQMRIWRSEVWEFCYAYLDDVLNGKKEIPTLEELIVQLPKINW